MTAEPSEPGTGELPAGSAPSAPWHGRAALILSWLVGGAMLGGVVAVALHWSEERELLQVAREAEPWWLAVALLLQAGTYLAQAGIWRGVARARGVKVPLALACRLSLAKLFIDQALPSAGISGTVLAAHALAQRGVGRGIVMAAMVIDGIAYYGAYALALLVALLVAAPTGTTRLLFLPGALLLALFSAAFGAAALLAAGRRVPWKGKIRRIPLLGTVAALLAQSDAALVRSPALLARSVGLQLAVVLLDAATVLVLVYALGATAPPLRVFGSFMASSLLRTVSIIPGGLGVFEAASVVTLQQAGTSIPVALGATLLFRGLSFWLPMAPGLWFTRKFRKGATPAGRPARRAT